MHSLRQRGEITFTLSLIGLFVSLLGIGIGAFSVNNSQTTDSQAQSGDFPYESIMEVRQGSVSGPVVNWEKGLRWNNNFPTTVNEGDVRDAFGKARAVWTTQSMDTSLRNQTAFVTLTVPSSMQIIGTFCEDRAGNTCATHQVTADKREIWNLRLTKDAKITYGWIVQGGSTGQPEPTSISVPLPTYRPGQPTSVPQPTTGQQPTTPPSQVGIGNLEVQIVALNYPKRTSFWSGDHIASKEPTSCERLSSSSQQRPLYLNKVSVVATCIAGDCTVGKEYEGKNEKNQGYVNFNGKPTGTYRIDRVVDIDGKGFSLWDGCRNKTFTIEKDKINQQAVVILQNKTEGTYETYTTESKCKSDGGEPNLIQGIGGNLCYLPQGKPAPVQPTSAPGGGGGGGGGSSDLVCTQKCIYSQGTPTNFKCYEGACPKDRPDCGGNTPKERIDNGNKGCQFAGTQCGLPANEVSCTTGERIGGSGGGGNIKGKLTINIIIKGKIDEGKKVLKIYLPLICLETGCDANTYPDGYSRADYLKAFVFDSNTDTRLVSYTFSDTQSGVHAITQTDGAYSDINDENIQWLIPEVEGCSWDKPGSNICDVSLSATEQITVTLTYTIPGSEGASPTPPPTPPSPPTVLPYTIEIRNTTYQPVSNYKEVIRTRWPDSKDYADRIIEKSLIEGWNPSLILALWMAETGSSTTTKTEAGGAGIGRVLSNEHLGCNPQTIQQIEPNLDCIFQGSYRKNLRNDEFEEFVASMCGPNLEVLCSNNRNFVKTLGSMYDKLVPPGTRGARVPVTAAFSLTDLAQVDPTEKTEINAIELNSFYDDSHVIPNHVTILRNDQYLFGYSAQDETFYVDVYSAPYTTTLKKAQKDIMQTLDVTRNESCYLGIYGTGAPDIIPSSSMFTSLPYCEGPARVDFNEDGVVNGVDYAEVLEGVLSPTSDMVADLNLNGVVDAMDISIALQHFGEDVVVEEEPIQTLVEPEFEE